MPTYIDTVLKEKIEEIVKEAIQRQMNFDEYYEAEWEEPTEKILDLLKSSLEHFAQMVEEEVIGKVEVPPNAWYLEFHKKDLGEQRLIQNKIDTLNKREKLKDEQRAKLKSLLTNQKEI